MAYVQILTPQEQAVKDRWEASQAALKAEEERWRNMSPEDYEEDEEEQIHIGPRGGRYYKRTRVDGTTYREYTW